MANPADENRHKPLWLTMNRRLPTRSGLLLVLALGAAVLLTAFALISTGG